MRIVASQVEAHSQHQFQRSEQRLQVRSEGRNQPPGQLRREQTPAPQRPQPVAPAPRPLPAAAPSPQGTTEENLDPSDKLAVGVSLLKALVEAMTGKRIETAEFDASATSASALSFTSITASTGSGATVSALSISEYEYLEVSFSAQLETADGGSLSIDLSFKMERSFQFQSISATSGNATDPVLLNFDGAGARLAGSFDFDLNSDGSAETLSALAPGSAWLALDRNGNGAIDDGAELFGPTSGDGFAELTQYDDDGNGFIDSGDAIFAQLQLFRPDSGLATLAERDVGAIFLGAVASPFRFNDGADRTLAQLRATSFYASQNGGGLVQQLDLSA